MLHWRLGAAAAGLADFSGSAWVEVDAAGKARVVEMERLTKFGDVPELEQRLNERLRAQIEAWRFAPAVRNGLLVPSRTHLTVDLRATDDGTGRFGVRVLRARTGGKLGRVRELGPLLHAAARSDQSGRATLEIDYDSTGRVRKVEVVDAAMLRRGGLEQGWTANCARR